MKNSKAEDKKRRRLNWSTVRAVMETDSYKHLKYGEKTKRRWPVFDFLIKIFGFILRFTPFFSIGFKNAQNIILNHVDLFFENLPEDFDGYTILHMTDLHLDSLPDIDINVCKKISGLEIDLCVLTGDYRLSPTGGFNHILNPLQNIVSAVNHKDGIFAILGNHDTGLMLEPFEKTGISMLVNETAEITRKNSKISITGLDDPYYYYTEQALQALEESTGDFKIALVHTPSMFDIASDNGFSLYLTGHTHGGQICLPGGIAIIKHLHHGKKYYRGLWHYKNLTGYTGQGVGVVGIPVRFNTQSEITVLKLHKNWCR